MSKPTNDPASAIKAETDRRFIQAVEADLKEREALRQEARAKFVREHGEALFNAWFEGIKEKFRTDAGETYDADRPEWTFERVAELVLAKNMTQASARAAWIATHAPKKGTR